jgi:adenosylcobinamide-phosphate synthase
MRVFPIFYLYIIPAAFVFDLIFGDPESLPHPVRWMGRSISALEPRFRKFNVSLKTSGAILSIFLILMTWCLTLILVLSAQIIHPILKTFIEIILIYYCISIRSLRDSAMEVYRLLNHGELGAAKKKLSFIVGRDVEKLSEQGVAMAAVETVAENLVDGVISPLFFAAIGGAPLAMAYKMVNTLDSMIGYKNGKYEQFGKAAARIDDFTNFIPARLSVPIITLAVQILSGKGRRAFKTAIKEGSNHASPNAGYPEAAFAGGLGIKLGGPNYYGEQLVSKPYIGGKLEAAEMGHIKKACDIMMLSSLLWLTGLYGFLAFI